ncbi:nuclear transport factor 2 family protein [Aurantiacibacter sediminis]|nr:nuclear transport factor 2 family protein [Aurantiacibacter sediminis]
MFGYRKRQNIKQVRRYIAALNNRDADEMIGMLHEDCCFVDSKAFCVEGRADCASSIRNFMRMNIGFRLNAQSFSVRDGDVLIKGYTEADDASFAQDTLWMVRMAAGKLAHWQSFGGSEGASVARAVLPAAAKPFNQLPY